MKYIFLLLLLSRMLPAVAQQHYPQVSAEFMAFYNKQQDDSIYALLSPKINTMFTLAKVKEAFPQIYAKYGSLKSLALFHQDSSYCTYKAAFDHDTLVMVLALDGNGQIVALNFRPYPQAAGASAKPLSNFNLTTASGQLFGTLDLPAGSQPVPVVLIIAGSGPTTRDGNSGGGITPQSYKMLADSLLAHGIASVRYDKRGVAESAAAMTSENDVRFDNYVSDAVGFIQLLKADKRFSKVIVLGHSEGSLIGMIAAGQAHADAYISASGAGDRIDKILEKQFADQSSPLSAESVPLFDSLSKGLTVKQPGDDTGGFFRPSIQPYLISWIRYNPQTEIAKLHIPVLILQGTTDIQVSVQDAQALAKAKPDATLELIEGMNHILKDAPAERQANIATYMDPKLPLKAALVSDIVAFIRTV